MKSNKKENEIETKNKEKKSFLQRVTGMDQRGVCTS